MEDRELSIERILQISSALEMGLGIEDLPSGVTTMRLGNLANEIRSYVIGFNQGKEVERKNILRKQRELKKPDPKDQQQVNDYNTQFELLNMDYAEAIEKMKEKLNVEKKNKTIKCPEFKLSEFLAAEDFTRVISLGQGQTQEIKIKKGQALLPAAFFSNMGDLISE